MIALLKRAALAAPLALAFPAAAQDADREGTVFSGDWLTIGVGGALVPSYAGSDDYVVNPLPVVVGSIAGVGIRPRAGGLKLDFVPAGDAVDFDAGVAARLRGNRAYHVDDPLVASLGRLDRAIEVGPSVGIGFGRVFNPFDRLTFGIDAAWDVNGAHGGYVVGPGVTYSTPLSRGIAASMALSAEWANSEFHDYYYAVTPAQSTTTGGALAPFAPDGGGFTRAGATVVAGFDLNGELADGGWAMFAIGGYSRMLGDARRTPFTSTLGSANQFIGGLGIGYTF